MSAREKIIDDLARLAGGTVSIVSNARNNAREDVKSRIDDLALRLELVPRSEFERLELVLQETRKQLEDLQKEVEALKKSKKGKK